MTVLGRDFYSRDTLTVARELLGQIVCRSVDGNILRGRVVETEAYMPHDPAAHSFHGMTDRTRTMFQRPGTAYVYLIYGIYHCLNIVTDRENYGSAVLIRSLEGLNGLNSTNGPGKLCRAMAIDLSCNGKDVTLTESGIWVEKGELIPAESIVQTTRVGIRRAVDYPWRFYISNNRCVSTFKEKNIGQKLT
jgi:DNA-3-methyladenine glycosylase